MSKQLGQTVIFLYVSHANMQDLPFLTAELILAEDSMFSPRLVDVVAVVDVVEMLLVSVNITIMC